MILGQDPRWSCLEDTVRRFIHLLPFVVAMIGISACSHLPPPATFIVTYDEPGTWKTIEVRDGLTKENLWRKVVDGLTQKFDLEMLDKEAGYIRTTWKYTYVVDSRLVDRYRSRIIVKFLGEGWGRVQIKCEAHWMERDSGWVMGYDMRLLEDAFGDIQGRIGRLRR